MAKHTTNLSLLRDPLHVQWAHDLLAGLVLGHDSAALSLLFDSLTKLERVAIRESLNALCWVLHHDHNEAFAENLQKIYEAVNATGAVKFPKPPWEE